MYNSAFRNSFYHGYYCFKNFTDDFHSIRVRDVESSITSQINNALAERIISKLTSSMYRAMFVRCNRLIRSFASNEYPVHKKKRVRAYASQYNSPLVIYCSIHGRYSYSAEFCEINWRRSWACETSVIAQKEKEGREEKKKGNKWLARRRWCIVQTRKLQLRDAGNRG